ncbi:unnamed protein product [Protopolystoma xenopodis]|uniref:Uncharacterized protein n=1 Tax=Protopolystoma xenopodis TaxID=117903 RepID=A0A448WS04_9PLAT|nr:unnamed protein product [Protopolystoma xenopodis]
MLFSASWDINPHLESFYVVSRRLASSRLLGQYAARLVTISSAVKAGSFTLGPSSHRLFLIRPAAQRDSAVSICLFPSAPIDSPFRLPLVIFLTLLYFYLSLFWLSGMIFHSLSLSLFLVLSLSFFFFLPSFACSLSLSRAGRLCVHSAVLLGRLQLSCAWSLGRLPGRNVLSFVVHHLQIDGHLFYARDSGSTRGTDQSRLDWPFANGRPDDTDQRRLTAPTATVAVVICFGTDLPVSLAKAASTGLAFVDETSPSYQMDGFEEWSLDKWVVFVLCCVVEE